MILVALCISWCAIAFATYTALRWHREVMYLLRDLAVARQIIESLERELRVLRGAGAYR